MKRNHFLILLLVLAGGTFLRFYGLAEKTLWLDEINGIRIALTPWDGFWAAVKNSDHPPLFFLVHRIFLSFGENEFLARLPAAAFGVLSIFSIFVLGKNTLGRTAGLLAAFLWSFSVIDISQSQNARNYTILVFLAILSLNFLVQAFYQDRRGAYWAWIAANLFILYTHYFGLFVVSGEALFLFFRLFRNRAGFSRSGDFRRIVFGIFLPFLGFLPWAVFIFFQQASRLIGYFSYYLEPTGQSLLVLVNYFVYSVWDTFTVRYPRSPLIVLGILLAFGMAGKKRPGETARGLLVFFPLITLATVFSLAAVEIKMITPRNLLIILPALCLLVSRGILVMAESLLTRLWPKRGPGCLLPAALILSVILLGRLGFATLAQYYNDGYHLENDRGSWKQAVGFLRENLRPEDRALAFRLPGTSKLCLEYYLKKEKLQTRVEFRDDLESLRNSLDRENPGYLLLPHEDGPPEDPEILHILENRLVAARHYHLLDVYYLDRVPDPGLLPASISRIGKASPPARLAAGDFVYSSDWFTMQVIQGRYTVNLFNGGFLAYRFFCQDPGFYAISTDLRKEELWRETAAVEMILDESPITFFKIEKSSRWVSGGSRSVFVSGGYHYLVLKAVGKSGTSRGLALSLSGITIKKNDD